MSIPPVSEEKPSAEPGLVSPDRPAAIEIEGLTKVFRPGLVARPVVAVRNLSLTVQPGQVYGLLGPNGSGKSTTMKILLGLIPPTVGRTRVFGIESTQVRSRQSVGFLPENPYFYRYLTGRETLRFYGRICGMSGKVLRERIPELLKLVGLEEAADRRIAGYSKGMLQRIGLAQAIIQDPRLVVLDEPTAGVDPVGSREIRDLILELKERGKTVLLCSHLLAQVQQVCDRIGIMSKGVLVREGPLEDLIKVESQYEIVLEGADEPTIEAMKNTVSGPGRQGKIVRSGRPQTTLEDLFLRETSAPVPETEPETEPRTSAD